MKQPFAYPLAVILISIDMIWSLIESLLGFSIHLPSSPAICQHV